MQKWSDFFSVFTLDLFSHVFIGGQLCGRKYARNWDYKFGSKNPKNYKSNQLWLIHVDVWQKQQQKNLDYKPIFSIKKESKEEFQNNIP